MVRIIDAPRLIQAAGSPPKTIAEHIGRVVSNTDSVSIAMMKSPPGWSEPGQTPEFDEYSLVLSGRLILTTRDTVFTLSSGQAAIAPAGEWIQYSSPDGAEYLAVCLPAFGADIVHRDDESGAVQSGQANTGITYEDYGTEGLGMIEDLWSQLREHHACHARHFCDTIRSVSYVDRCNEIIRSNQGRHIRVFLARSVESAHPIGFCICSGAGGDFGEIESIYVMPQYRSLGIGTSLMNQACAWLEKTGVSESRVRVCEGNEASFRFYERFGFYVRRHMLVRRIEVST